VGDAICVTENVYGREQSNDRGDAFNLRQGLPKVEKGASHRHPEYE
jgi:hypothetical protein